MFLRGFFRSFLLGTALAGLSGCSAYTLSSGTFSAVSFTIDDGAEQNWVPLFSSKGIVGTAFIITGPEFMNSDHWKALRVLQSAGWEIGGHSRTHPHLTTVDEATLASEIGGCRDDLIAHGITNPVSFAYPYSDFDATVEAAAHRYFLQSRAGDENGGQGFNLPPYDWNALKIIDGDTGSLEQLKAAADDVKARRLWLILILHTYRPDHPDEVLKAEKISALIDYIQAQSIPILTVAQAADLARSR